MRAVLLLAATLVAGCNAVFGLEERGLDEDVGGDTSLELDAELDGLIADSSADSSTDDASLPLDTATPPDTTAAPDTATPPDTAAPPDTAVPPDTAPPDTMPVDTAPPLVACPIFGLKCAAGQTCIVSRTSTGAYSYACETPPPGATMGADCHLDGGRYKCAAGLACNDRFPSGTICVPLCATATSCGSTAGYPLCNDVSWSTVPAPTVDVCDYCDPASSTTCSGEGRCGIASMSTPPSCGKSFGGRDPGQACNPGQCTEGSVCDCGTELGIDGCAGKPGVCVKICRTAADCVSLPGKSCLPLRTGYPINGCK